MNSSGRSSNGYRSMMASDMSSSVPLIPRDSKKKEAIKNYRRKIVMRAATSGRDRGSSLPTWSASSGMHDDGSYYEDDDIYSDYSADSSSALSRGTRTTKSLINRNRSNSSPILSVPCPSSVHSEASMVASSDGSVSVGSVDQDLEGMLPSSAITTSASSAAMRHRRTGQEEHLDGGGWNGIGGGDTRGGRSRGFHNQFRVAPSNSVRKLRRYDTFWNIQNQIEKIVQVCIVLIVVYLLFDSHSKANLIAAEVKENKDQVSMLFLHLHRIQEHSLQLHESMERFSLEGIAKTSDQNDSGSLSDGNVENSNQSQQQEKSMFRGAGLNMDLIHKQTQQLLQMEEEINHEVRNLHAHVQRTAVRSIVREYGEGPVQIVLELQLEGETTRSLISILLWHDAPHAAWTWLEQINRGLWNGASFHMDNTRILSANPSHPDTETHLDFVEKSSHTHEAWTVGLTDNPSTDGLELFINLEDNTDFSRHNVCAGKVFDGFNALHRLMERVQTQKERMIDFRTNADNGNNNPEDNIRPVKILSARASPQQTKKSPKALVS